MDNFSVLVFWAVAGYIAGSIPFGWIIGRLLGKDVRTFGSGNIGATNLVRAGGKSAGIITFALDFLKGAIPAGLAIRNSVDASVAAGLFAVIGHDFPITLRFKGGKGVSSTLGVLSVWSTPLLLIASIVWLTLFAVLKISSLSSLVALLSIAVAGYFMISGPLFYALLFLVALAVVRHYPNIKRLLYSKEKRF
ncbi:MAG: glycerol-3-phosphate 1-O-acyltransferase PlsY [Epsilonproteobacteria bacterium]|nr:glycerol-3-phosphate 1-O-acyltransferase PlsY [Campylobacterota bacterium]